MVDLGEGHNDVLTSRGDVPSWQQYNVVPFTVRLQRGKKEAGMFRLSSTKLLSTDEGRIL